ncbi:MAG TPA: hypothetical protein V6C89_12395 [Drouetiella sp.]
MIILLYMLLAIGIIGATITLVSILHNLDVTEIMPVYKPRQKRVGPTFWGNYQDNGNRHSVMQTIKLPKITFNGEAIAGSELYSKGHAVKSAKR